MNKFKAILYILTINFENVYVMLLTNKATTVDATAY